MVCLNAVTKDGRSVCMYFNPYNSDASTLTEVTAKSVTPCDGEIDIPSITLEDILNSMISNN